jgi:hypothetical protein
MRASLHPALHAAALAVAAALAGGAVDGLGRASVAGAATAIARTALMLAPLGFALVLAARLLSRSWRPLELPRARLRGGVAFALLAAFLVGAAGWAGTAAAHSLTHVPRLAGLTVAAFAAGGALVAALLSLPAIRALSALLTDERARRAAIFASALALLGWIAIVLRAPAPWPALATFAAVLAAASLLRR